MQRIDTPYANNGKFQGGNPQTGAPPTTLSPAWCNAIQEELCSILEAAGVPLDKTKNNQLPAAIERLAHVWTAAVAGQVVRATSSFDGKRLTIDFPAVVDTSSGLTLHFGAPKSEWETWLEFSFVQEGTGTATKILPVLTCYQNKLVNNVLQKKMVFIVNSGGATGSLT